MTLPQFPPEDSHAPCENYSVRLWLWKDDLNGPCSDRLSSLIRDGICCNLLLDLQLNCCLLPQRSYWRHRCVLIYPFTSYTWTKTSCFRTRAFDGSVGQRLSCVLREMCAFVVLPAYYSGSSQWPISTHPWTREQATTRYHYVQTPINCLSAVLPSMYHMWFSATH